MKDKEKADLLKWIHCWKTVGEVLEKTRRAKLCEVDVQLAIENLDDAFESALLHSPVRLSSGLVELQAWFAKVRI